MFNSLNIKFNNFYFDKKNFNLVKEHFLAIGIK